MIWKGLTEILKDFKARHADLMAFEPRVEIAVCNLDGDNFPDVQIFVWHPFIFDNRLVPEEFEGIKVINVTESSTLPPSLNPPCDCELWKVEDPFNYVGFVEEYFDIIQDKLRSHMEKEEMLDALTGVFKKLVTIWNMKFTD